jgi:hypothetical protein
MEFEYLAARPEPVGGQRLIFSQPLGLSLYAQKGET